MSKSLRELHIIQILIVTDIMIYFQYLEMSV